jgi:hypothetical protein
MNDRGDIIIKMSFNQTIVPVVFAARYCASSFNIVANAALMGANAAGIARELSVREMANNGEHSCGHHDVSQYTAHRLFVE